MDITDISPADAEQQPCVLLANGSTTAGHGAVALTGIDLTLPIVVGIALLIVGVLLVIAARRRRRERAEARRSMRSLLIVAALLIGAIGVGEVALAAPAIADDGCALISFSSDRSQNGILLGPDEVETERVTVNNVTNGDIDVVFSSTVIDDQRTLAPFVAINASCTCASAPLVSGILSSAVQISQAVRITAHGTITITVKANTIEAITNDLQGSELTYALVAHAMEVGA